MGLSGTLIILGLIASGIYAQNPEVQIGGGGGIIQQKDGSTYLANEAGQIFRRPDGKIVLIGANGQQLVTDSDDSDEDDDDDSHSSHSSSEFNNVVINGGDGGGTSFYQTGGKSYMFVTAQENSYINSNGHSLKVINGGLQLEEGGKQYTFLPRAADVNQKETVDINGKPATVEYSGGNVIIELADKTLIAKLGNRIFVGDRDGFNNRDKLESEINQQARLARENAVRLQQQISLQISQTMEKIQRDLQQSLGKLGL
ncbi:uncharacterized protein Dwil_GK19306 [Drosophila willistoni]|uniref:CG18067 protein n=1 Tax=Drosophila willistoni TaxID=7260 RepID=B4MKF5_DROWI|nr:uncharacterized protein LOC6638420 [Drosophila willistoni]EDW72594.2 uncharacterized protein Dwil_GK19306 [Drosophila willistoni]